MAQRFIILLGALLYSLVAQAEQSEKFTALGAYSDFQFTQEHQYGTGIQLWQEGSLLFGILSHSQGLIGDTPTGVLEKLTFDPKTCHISFSARLTMGQHYCKVHKDVPSQDIFHVEGVLTKSSLSGTLKHTDNLHQDQAATEEKMVLKKSDAWKVAQYPDREQWNAAVKDILNVRGPRW